MTLVLTQFTPKGIVMAADSMATIRGSSYPNATKLHQMPDMAAGVSVWGRSSTGISPDEWLTDFLSENKSGFSSIGEFAHELENQARDEFEKQELDVQMTGEPRASLGYHIAGYDDGEERFFNINNATESGRPGKVELGDKSELAKKRSEEHEMWTVRNGAWEDYAILFRNIARFTQEINQVSDDEFRIPYPPILDNYAKYLGFQILLVSAIHELSSFSGRDSRPVIGGNVQILMITENGIVDSEKKTLTIDPKRPEDGIQLR